MVTAHTRLPGHLTYLTEMSSYGTFFSSSTIITRREQVEMAMPADRQMYMSCEAASTSSRCSRSFDLHVAVELDGHRALAAAPTVDLKLR